MFALGRWRNRKLSGGADRGIASTPFVNEREGLQAIVDHTVDAFVFDEIILKYAAKTDFPGRVRVLPGTFDQYVVSMGLPNGSSLREPINRALLEIMEKEKWAGWVKRYTGNGS